jgi:predicted  nucleic acid-binding Zn-ribbon protein
MHVRHRIPSIFNLSMVDVLCCALGCVILLWLINLREAKYHEESAEEEHRRISTELASIRAERDQANIQKKQLEEQLRALQEDKSDLQKHLNTLQAEAADRARRLQLSSQRIASLENDLRKRSKRQEELQITANLVPTLQAELKEARQQYTAEKARASALEKEIAQRTRDLEKRDKQMAALHQQNKALQSETARVRAAAEKRFAGIALTGRRVLFLVDMSGSMDLVDEKTKAPTKWADVCNTVARLMNSLPDLEKYQVLVFAEQAAFLFAGEEDWLDFHSQSSPQRVREALAKITPKGGTNMYAALQRAFRLRAKGMDTIYLFSDGLPNLGEGIRADMLNTLTEVERNEQLARHIRRTLQSNWNRPLPDQPRVRINTIGFFYESPDVGAFLWALARENDGSFVGMSRP